MISDRESDNDNDRVNDPQGDLYVYAKNRSDKDLSWLLKEYKEIDINKPNENKQTALHSGIEGLNEDNIKCLLEHKANPNIKCGDKDCFEYLFGMEKSKDTIETISSITNMLLKYKAIPLKSTTAYKCWSKTSGIAQWQQQKLSDSMEKINEAYKQHSKELSQPKNGRVSAIGMLKAKGATSVVESGSQPDPEKTLKK